MLDVFLELTPTPKERPRMGKSGRVYTPTKTRQAERDIKLYLIGEVNKIKYKITDKPVCVKLRFNYLFPKKLNEHDKLLADLEMLYKATRPDLDNLCKLVCDAMNGIVYFDDNQIVKLVCEKVYSKREGIEIKVLEI